MAKIRAEKRDGVGEIVRISPEARKELNKIIKKYNVTASRIVSELIIQDGPKIEWEV